MSETINAHRFSHLRDEYVPTWTPARTPDENARACGSKTGSTRRCSYCGSMHPADLAAALRAGARAEWADWKYGWPHKMYVEGVTNPNAGLLEVVSATYGRPTPEEIAAGGWKQYQDGYDPKTGQPAMKWVKLGDPTPAPATTWGKFYTEHLQDATPEDREVIERAMGLRFTFGHGERGAGVRWAPFAQEASA